MDLMFVCATKISTLLIPTVSFHSPEEALTTYSEGEVVRRPADYAALVGLPGEGDYDSLIGYSSLAVRPRSLEVTDGASARAEGFSHPFLQVSTPFLS